MYASIDFATKKDFCLAVQQGLPIALYSPTLGMPAINGTATVYGPWPNRRPCIGPADAKRGRKIAEWKARVVVRDMRVVEVH